MTPTKFTLDISNFVKKAKGRSHQATRLIVMGMGTRIVERSPVGDPIQWKDPGHAPAGYTGGRFRGNWQYGYGSAPQTVDLGTLDPSGQVSLQRLQAIPDQAAGLVHYWVNNLPYGPRLEAGWSSQAPSGMVGLTVIEYKQIVQRAAAEVNK